ncbi:aldo/keto reductase [Streptococcus suis]|nr:aldo/keto reductase [Streptococcus suis]
MTQESAIIIGTWSWGSGGFAGGDTVFGHQLEAQDLTPVIDLAMTNGINTFDTAYAYANGQSESILGELLAAYPRDSFRISTKFTPQLAQLETSNPVITMLEGSLKRMKIEAVDLYWIHNSSDIDKWTPYLVDAVKTKKIKSIGVSNHNLEQVKRVVEILKPHGIRLSAVQNHFSLLYRQSIDDGLLDYCQENGIDFYSYMVLEQGLLSGKYDEQHLLPAGSRRGERFNHFFPQLRHLLEQLKDLATKYHVTSAQIAIAWAMAKGTSPIIGITSKEQVQDLIAVKQLQLTPIELQQLEELAIQSGVDTRGGWEGEA